MLTLYELKQNACFRCIYKSPAIVRNLFLMIGLTLILVPIYLIYFFPGDSSYQSMLKLLKGMNSSTFNYLENKKDRLLINRAVPELSKSFSGSWPSSQEFFSDCVRMNRPCVLRSLAKTWPASTKWLDKNGGPEYLKQKLKGT